MEKEKAFALESLEHVKEIIDARIDELEHRIEAENIQIADLENQIAQVLTMIEEKED